jgi:DNA-binding transcriptional ArsR family regulator
MSVNDAAADDLLDATLTALADPTRRAIVRRLVERGEMRVTDLAEPFAMSLNAVSKHIRTLERARLVRRRRAWREHLVSFDPAPIIEAMAWMDNTRAFWTSRLDALEQLLKDEDAALAAAKPAAAKRKSTATKPKTTRPKTTRPRSKS